MDSAAVQAQDAKTIARIKRSLAAECARLLAAVSTIASKVTEQDMAKLLRDESLWLSSSLDEPISVNVMMDAFRESGRQAAMFESALHYFQEEEEQQQYSVQTAVM